MESQSGEGTARIIDTFKKAAAIASDHGERLAVEGEICFGRVCIAGRMSSICSKV